MKKVYLLLKFVLPIFSLIGCVPQQEQIETNPYLIKKNAKPWIIAHGGAKDLFPENTMVAFQGSMAIGVDMLEMDVNLTKDGILITQHDLTIDGVTDGTGNVMDYTFEALMQFNFGYDFKDLDGNYTYRSQQVEVTKLESVMTAFPNTPMMVEIKNREESGRAAAEELWRLIQVHNFEDKMMVVAFDDATLSYFQEISNNAVLISTSEAETKDFVFSSLSAMDYVYSPKASAVAIPMENSGIDLTKKRVINAAHRRNMAVHYWTIDDKADMKLLIKNGADGLITDRPDLMHEVLVELGF
jgi:glycerophosphoryl diester phosphodiesterase